MAGFEEPTSGAILLDGEDVARKPPHKRNVNTVFQSYALFPFLSVADNVAFGLRYQEARQGRDGRAGRVRRSSWCSCRATSKRRPGQLSGGQQQRVALARALVLNPSVLLLDEPLGALDAKLRRTLQVELKALQETVGITFLYVTHDQEEALTMSDRLAVMEAGRVAQVGPPVEVYEQPANAYVADFLGVSNLMDAHGVGRGPDGRRAGSAWETSTCGRPGDDRRVGAGEAGHPARAGGHRALRLVRAQPGPRHGGAPGVPRLVHPGHRPPGGRFR